jgi:drug/metabolite transporter (DMT)-like permease
MKLGLGQVTILNYAYPVFAALLSPRLIGEKLSIDVVAACLFAFLGIWLVVDPGRISSIGVETLFALLGRQGSR